MNLLSNRSHFASLYCKVCGLFAGCNPRNIILFRISPFEPLFSLSVILCCPLTAFPILHNAAMLKDHLLLIPTFYSMLAAVAVARGAPFCSSLAFSPLSSEI